MKIFLCCFLTLTAASGALGISYGRNVSLGEMPYLLSLQVLNDFSPVVTDHSCGGVLVADQWVLSNAHCVDRHNRYTVISAIYGGFVDLTKIGEVDKYTVLKQYIQPQYHRKGPYVPALHDLALIKLSEKVELTKNFNIATLPDVGEEPDYSKPFTLAGWGQAETTSHKYFWPRVLVANDFPVLDYDKCYSRLMNYTKNVEDQFALDEKLSICVGPEDPDRELVFSADTGSPLLQNGKVYGILSYILNYGDFVQITPSAVFVKIEPYLDWIRETIKKY